MSTTAREQVTSRNLLEWLRKSLPFAHGLLVTTLPRGDVQIAQPANVAESQLRAYAEGLHAEDHLTWQALLRNKVLRPSDVREGDGFTEGAYYRQLLQPLGLRYAVVAPLAGPVLDGYPGTIHLFRTADQGDFTRADIEKVTEQTRKFNEAMAQGRGGKRGNCSPRPPVLDRPAVHVLVLNEQGKAVFPKDADAMFDTGLRTT